MIGLIAMSRGLMRASLLAMLLLGILVKPTLIHISDLHAAEHAVLAEAQHAHSDHDDADHAGHPADDGHTNGPHGLMHQADTGGSSIPLFSLTSAAVLPPDPMLGMPDYAVVPRQRSTSPFRPPITS